MKIYVCHSSDFDYETELYSPLRKSKLNDLNEIFLPHEEKNKIINTTSTIKNSDLILAEVSFSSTGLGIELGRAEMMNKKTVCFYKKGSKISKSLNFITNNFIEYETFDEFLEKLEAYLN